MMNVRNDVIRFCLEFREKIILPNEQEFGLCFEQKISAIKIEDQIIPINIALYKGQWIIQKQS